MTKYLSSTAFSSPANSKSYSDNYDSVFGKQEPEGKHECQWSPSHGWEHCDFCESWNAAVLAIESSAPIHTPCQYFDLADSFAYVCYYYHHSGTEMEEHALEAGTAHGLSDEYTLARFYSHPEVVELGYEAE